MSRVGVPGGAVHDRGGHNGCSDGARAVGDCQSGGLKIACVSVGAKCMFCSDTYLGDNVGLVVVDD